MKIDFERLRKGIAEGELESSLKELEKIVESEDILNYITLLKFRLSFNKSDYHLGLKTREESNVEQNRITKLILELISELSFNKSGEIENYVRESIKENLPPILMFERESINNILGLVKYSKVSPPLILYKIAVEVFISINKIISKSITNNYDGYHGYPNSGGFLDSFLFGEKSIKENPIVDLRIRYIKPTQLEKDVSKFMTILERQYSEAYNLIRKKYKRRLLLVIGVGEEYYLKDLSRNAVKIYKFYISVIIKSICYNLKINDKLEKWDKETLRNYDIISSEVVPFLRSKKFRSYESHFYSVKEHVSDWLERENSFLGLKFEDFEYDGNYNENMSEDEHGVVHLYKIKESQISLLLEKFAESVK